MKNHDAVVVGAGPNGLAAAIELAPRGTLGARARGGREDRRRPALRRADAAGLRPRPLLGDPPDGGGLPVLPDASAREHGLEWVEPPAAARAPARRRRGGRCCGARSRRRPTRPRRGRQGATGGPSAARRGLAALLEGALLGPLVRVPAPPGRAGAASASGRSGPRSGSRAGASRRAARGRSSPGSRRTRSCRSSGRLGVVRARARIDRSRRRLAPRRAAARRRSPTRSPRTCARSAARSSPARRSSRSTSCRPRAVPLRREPRQFLRLAGDRLPAATGGALERFRYGPGVFKLDWALVGPIPWAAPECAGAGTIHLGGTLDEIAASERRRGAASTRERPFVLLAQPSDVRPSRAPDGPAHGLGVLPRPERLDGRHDRARSSAQVERFAPGFRELVLARNAMRPRTSRRENAN